MPTSPGQSILLAIRNGLVTGNKVPQTLDAHDLGVDFKNDGGLLFITLFQPGKAPLRAGSQRKTFPATLDRVVDRLRNKSRFDTFNPEDVKECRIMVEIVVRETPVDAKSLHNSTTFGRHRFEPGVTGIKATREGLSNYYLPTDATIHGERHISQALRRLARMHKVRRSELSQPPTKLMLLETRAFVSFGEELLFLFRGLPATPPLTPTLLREQMGQSANWLMDNLQPDGRFLYYYHLGRDSARDLANTANPDYFNLARHTGGIIGLLRIHERLPNPRHLETAQKALTFLDQQCLREETPQGEHCYAYYDNKATLGGSGIALMAMTFYRQLCGDDRFDATMTGLVRHLLSRTLPSGEMLCCYIHPRHNDGQPLLDPSPKLRKRLFNLFYPGEALLGLIGYLKTGICEPKLAEEIREAAKRAIDFLVRSRPIDKPRIYDALPSDSWLMQTIEAWWQEPGFQEPAWRDYVFADAEKFIRFMYQPGETPYPDYPGAFHREFGEVARQYNSRAEGLMAAHYLAVQIGDRAMADYLLEKIELVATSLLPTFVSPESAFLCREPQKSIGAIRFKLNQQWVRVDSVMHTVCFQSRLLPVLEKGCSK
ncbi:MAG: hypothetical protein HQL52_06480 [Magnetococcales bacterium]|nr:hypothetical protein [Magnetococcales bacterium]